MEITASNEGAGVIVAALAGRLDAYSAPQFDAWFSGILSPFPEKLVIDMTMLEYVSSAGLRSILAAAKRLKGNGSVLLLSGVSGNVEEVFRISGFLSIIPSFGTVQEAIGAAA